MNTKLSKASSVLFMTCFIVCCIRQVMRQLNAKRCMRVLRVVVWVWFGVRWREDACARGCWCVLSTAVRVGGRKPMAKRHSGMASSGTDWLRNSWAEEA